MPIAHHSILRTFLVLLRQYYLANDLLPILNPEKPHSKVFLVRGKCIVHMFVSSPTKYTKPVQENKREMKQEGSDDQFVNVVIERL